MKYVIICLTLIWFGLANLQAQEDENLQTQDDTISIEQLKKEIEELKQKDLQKTQTLEKLKRDLENIRSQEIKPPQKTGKEAEEEFEPEIPSLLIGPAKDKEGKKEPSARPFLIEEAFDEEEQETAYYATGPATGIIEEESKKLTGGALTISGFATLEFADYRMRESSLGKTFGGRAIIGKDNTFSNSHVNLYIDAKFLEDFRFFTELRFLYSPASEFLAESLKFSRSGEVLIERAWMEWTFRDWFKVLGGNFFVPYGIWNLEHGDPILLSIRTPVVLRFQLFPERCTGIQIFGTVDLDEFEMTYYAWVGNGKGSRISSGDDQDSNNNKATGGRLQLKFPDSEPLRDVYVGVSGYIGSVRGPEYPNAITGLTPLFRAAMASEGNLATFNQLAAARFNAIGEPNGKYIDQVWGADIRFRLYGFFFQGEFIMNYVDPRNAINFKELGGYVQAAYEFNLEKWGLLSPYFQYAYLDANDEFRKELASHYIITAGLNWKPYTSVVLKTEYFFAKFKDVHTRDFDAFLASVSVSF